MPNVRLNIDELQFSDYEIEKIIKYRLGMNDRQFFKNGVLYEKDPMYGTEYPVKYNYKITPEILNAVNTLISYMNENKKKGDKFGTE